MYRLECCDCLDLQLQKDEVPSLVYMDPPYGPVNEDTYYGIGGDSKEYLSYIRDRLEHVKSLMGQSCNILVHLDYKYVHYIKIMMDELFGKDNFRNEIIWCYSNTAVNKTCLPRKHQSILWYGIGDYSYNIVRVPYKTNLNVGGKSAWSKEKIPWEHYKYYKYRGKLLEDWWSDIPAICRNEPEKTGYATQKPIALMKRIVHIFSNENEYVLDPFMGSGSTIEAAVRLGRNVIGCDANEEAVSITKNRIGKIIESDIFNWRIS